MGAGQSSGQFWDLVVLSAGDESQKELYLKQLEERSLENPPPQKDCKFVAIADPGGDRVGDGGSTLHILRKLVLS